MFTITEQANVNIVEMKHGKVNAMDIEFCNELTRVLDVLEKAAPPSLVLTGNGRIFSAGIDLKRLLAEPAGYVDQFLDAFEEAIERLFRFPKPIVAAVNGPAIAGGAIMAAACDHRIALPAAKIGLPELRIGVPLPIVCVEIMRSVLARQSFQQVVNIGATFHSQRAIEVGFINQNVDAENLLSKAIEVAGQLATIPLNVFAISKRQQQAPVMGQVREQTAAFGDEMRAIWNSDQLRREISEYVTQRI